MLSRPEVGEFREASTSAHPRGASSTMPQSINPVASETIVGLGFGASAAASVLLSAMLGGHERSAGEWQAEWDSVPYVFGYVGGALRRPSTLSAACRWTPPESRQISIWSTASSWRRH